MAARKRSPPRRGERSGCRRCGRDGVGRAMELFHSEAHSTGLSAGAGARFRHPPPEMEKQLEKDFQFLKAQYLALKDKYNALLDEKEKLAEEVERLREVESDMSLKLADYEETTKENGASTPMLSPPARLSRTQDAQSSHHTLRGQMQPEKSWG